MFGVPVHGYHRYADGSASMDIRAAGLVPVVHDASDELLQSETVTLLNDMCLFAPAALLDPALAWEDIDSRPVRVTFTTAGVTVRALLTFNDAGELIDFVSDDRYQASPDGRRMTRRRWSTPVTGYRRFGPMRLIATGEARWHTPDGSFAYIELEVDDVAYNVSALKLACDPRRNEIRLTIREIHQDRCVGERQHTDGDVPGRVTALTVCSPANDQQRSAIARDAHSVSELFRNRTCRDLHAAWSQVPERGGRGELLPRLGEPLLLGGFGVRGPARQHRRRRHHVAQLQCRAEQCCQFASGMGSSKSGRLRLHADDDGAHAGEVVRLLARRCPGVRDDNHRVVGFAQETFGRRSEQRASDS